MKQRSTTHETYNMKKKEGRDSFQPQFSKRTNSKTKTKKTKKKSNK